MIKIKNSKPVSVIEFWVLRFICNLVLEIWDFQCTIIPLPSITYHTPGT